MTMWLVVRSWAVEAESATEAIEKARPGEHTDVRALMAQSDVAAVRLTFATPRETQ